MATSECGCGCSSAKNIRDQRILWWVFGINFAFFLIEAISGFFSHSMALISDSLDMLTDAAIYALALVAMNRSMLFKKNLAKAFGCIQLLLAFIALAEIIRRFIGIEPMPIFQTMIIVSCFSIIANIASLVLLKKTENREAHIKASIICSSNDVIINAGVIVGGVGVWLLQSNIPDLVVGLIVFVLVVRGAKEIFKEAK